MATKAERLNVTNLRERKPPVPHLAKADRARIKLVQKGARVRATQRGSLLVLGA
jgi:hypothetical protein